MSRYELKGRRVLVVGASSGIGRAAALRIAAAGATVVVAARRADLLDSLVDEIVRIGGRAYALPVDLLDVEVSEAMVRSAAALLGAIDLALLNAGGAPALDMRKMTAAEVTRYMRTNYDVIVNPLVPVLDEMRRAGGGVVVHTNSLAGLIPVPLQGPYCAAKAAAKALIDTCRLEFAQFGIRFITLYPGFVATEATQDDGMPASGEISAEQAVDNIMRAIGELRPHTMFPAGTAFQVRALRAMPETWAERILAREVPPL